MKKYLYTAGTIALSLAIGGVPAAAFAQGADGSVTAGVAVTAGQMNAGATTTLRVREREGQLEDQAEATTSESAREAAKQQMEQVREAAKQQGEQVREQAKQVGEQVREMVKNRLELMLESSTTPALTLTQLEQSIQMRKQELDQEEASTTPDLQDVMKNANQVRLAVHALLASKDLLGGIGQQVSQVATQMNQSLATTTNAEAQIQSRGFWARLFFGGDSSAADTISQQVAQDEQNIAKLTDLINQASTTADVKATLSAQITAMQDQITRLQNLANGQKSLWGLFSWRF